MAVECRTVIHYTTRREITLSATFHHCTRLRDEMKGPGRLLSQVKPQRNHDPHP